MSVAVLSAAFVPEFPELLPLLICKHFFQFLLMFLIVSSPLILERFAGDLVIAHLCPKFHHLFAVLQIQFIDLLQLTLRQVFKLQYEPVFPRLGNASSRVTLRVCITLLYRFGVCPGSPVPVLGVGLANKHC